MEGYLIMGEHIVDIKIPQIEKELNRLSGTVGDAKQKASLFTLVIYAHYTRSINYVQELVDSILDKFPCRIIFIKADDQSQESYFRVNVSTVKSGSGNESTICDQITIESSADQLVRVPFLILPHLVPDLPVYLIWTQNPFEEKQIFPHLQSIASRVIFDSECADNLQTFCKDMKKSLDNLHIDIMDINWALISNWRDVIGQVFDSPEKLEQIINCKSMIISYNGYKTENYQHPEIRPIYLQGWIASRLKWRYKQTENINNQGIITYYSDNNPVVIGLHPKNYEGLPPGAIYSIEMMTTHGETFFITRKENNFSQVLVKSSSKVTCELPFTLPLPNVHRGMNFMKEIFYQKLSSHYGEMLNLISQIDFKLLTK